VYNSYESHVRACRRKWPLIRTASGMDDMDGLTWVRAVGKSVSERGLWQQQAGGAVSGTHVPSMPSSSRSG